MHAKWISSVVVVLASVGALLAPAGVQDDYGWWIVVYGVMLLTLIIYDRARKWRVHLVWLIVCMSLVLYEFREAAYQRTRAEILSRVIESVTPCPKHLPR